QDDVERRAPDAGGACVIGPGGDQHRAALAHIARDIVEIDDRQHALPRVAIKDDELKLVDLLLEQLARWEGDQRQFVDRGTVLLLRRAQNGEMHEIDAGIGLEQIAPRALARMRLAGAEQDEQLVAHAVDGDDRAIVDGGELSFERRRFDLNDIRPGVRDRHGDVDGGAHAHVTALDELAVAPYRHLRRTSRGALILDPEGDGLRLPDNAEAGGGHQHDAAIALVLVTRDETM